MPRTGCCTCCGSSLTLTLALAQEEMGPADVMLPCCLAALLPCCLAWCCMRGPALQVREGSATAAGGGVQVGMTTVALR